MSYSRNNASTARPGASSSGKHLRENYMHEELVKHSLDNATGDTSVTVVRSEAAKGDIFSREFSDSDTEILSSGATVSARYSSSGPQQVFTGVKPTLQHGTLFNAGQVAPLRIGAKKGQKVRPIAPVMSKPVLVKGSVDTPIEQSDSDDMHRVVVKKRKIALPVLKEYTNASGTTSQTVAEDQDTLFAPSQAISRHSPKPSSQLFRASPMLDQYTHAITMYTEKHALNRESNLTLHLKQARQEYLQSNTSWDASILASFMDIDDLPQLQTSVTTGLLLKPDEVSHKTLDTLHTKYVP